MTDRLLALANHPVTAPCVRMLGLPQPKPLRRRNDAYSPREFEGRRVHVVSLAATSGSRPWTALLEQAGAVIGESASGTDALLVDATECTSATTLDRLHAALQPAIQQLSPNGRVLLLLPAQSASAEAAACSRGLEGFMRSLAKELGRRGATANALYVDGDHAGLQAAITFFCSDRSAYVSGQALRLRAAVDIVRGSTRPVFAGQTAIVTGAAGGIGAATVRRLAADGAFVICVDIAHAQVALQSLALEVGGRALPLDITSPDAAQHLLREVAARGGLQVMVHNAGITRDRTLGRMTAAEWDAVLAVNLRAVLALDHAFDAARVWRDDAREICLSSITGIAGNAGQSNYGTAKAALIGYVAGRAREVGAGMTVNAVAPGFIETAMTRRIPFMVREAGRRLNALAQGGRPEDVAEAIAFLARPDAQGLTGQTLRVCGLSFLGA